MVAQKVGFYGGTFDPIHFGHINLAIELLERHQLDAVWFCPARQNPFKLASPPTEIKHRMKMTGLAIEEIPVFRLLDAESERTGSSYTIDTIRQLLRESEVSGIEIEFRLLMSDKEIPGFFQWREANELVVLAPPLIGSRSTNPPSFSKDKDPAVCEALTQGWTTIPMFDISATKVRERLKLKLYCGHLVPRKVLDYIYGHELY